MEITKLLIWSFYQFPVTSYLLGSNILFGTSLHFLCSVVNKNILDLPHVSTDWVINLRLLDIFLFPKTSRLPLVATQPHVKWVTGAPFFSVKWLRLNVTTYLCPVPRSRMSGALSPLNLSALVAYTRSALPSPRYCTSTRLSFWPCYLLSWPMRCLVFFKLPTWVPRQHLN
jgi:hypothetical protein